MKPPFTIKLDNNDVPLRGTMVEIHIADIHFGAIDPKVQYDILKTQFIDYIKDIDFDLISINGDLYDRKYLANQEPIRYANQFISDLVFLCASKKATLMIIEGTESHDSFQIRSFNHYLNNSICDVRIIETACFQQVKNKTILCLPEEYNKGKEYYEEFFNYAPYDACYMHGTFKGTVYGKNKEDLDSKREAVFSMENFGYCRGPIIAGHVHIAQCAQSHFYYCGSPIRWKFGEESAKGFYVLLHNLDEQKYYIHFEQINSFRYDTIELDELLLKTPEEVVQYIDNLTSNGVDYVKLKISRNNEMVEIIKSTYKNNSRVTIQDNIRQDVALNANQDIIDKYADMTFLTDPRIDNYTRFVMYCNYYEGENFITVKELKDILEGL